jgi:hypothetical protein
MRILSGIDEEGRAMSDRREDDWAADETSDELDTPTVEYSKLLLRSLGARRRALLFPIAQAERVDPRSGAASLLYPLEPKIQLMKEYCAQQAERGVPSQRHAYTFFWRHIVDMQPDTGELLATCRAWANLYRQRANILRQEGHFALAEDLDTSAQVCADIDEQLRKTFLCQ